MSSSSLPAKMRAVTVHDNVARLSDISLPALRPDYVLTKVSAVALNPTDWKHINGKRAAPSGISGCDFAGVVVQVGSAVTKSLKPGDRIAATTHGANFSQPEDGCFAEYAVAKGDLVIKLPDSVSFEKAATLPLGAGTVGQGLYQKALGLNLPTEPISPKDSQTVLIYGGSTATGSLAIQFAKLSGYRVITTCGSHNFSFVKSLGADEAYDYKQEGVGKKINADTNNSLKLVWDTISLPASAQICSEALSSDTADVKYGTILPVKPPREGIKPVFTFMYTIFGEAFTKAGRENPALEEDFEFGKKWFGIVESLVKEGKIKTHPEKVGEKGLEGVLQGMKDMKEDKVSAVKLVYRVEETPKESKEEVEL